LKNKLLGNFIHAVAYTVKPTYSLAWVKETCFWRKKVTVWKVQLPVPTLTFRHRASCI